jgi:hypothetical protein
MTRILAGLLLLISTTAWGAVSSGTFTIGPGQDYATISAFEAGLASELTGWVTGVINVAYNDTTAVTWAGVTTSAEAGIYLTVSAEQRHAGHWDAAKASWTVTNATLNSISGADFIVIDGLQLHVRGNGSDACFAVTISTNFTGLVIRNNLMRGNGSTGQYNRGARLNGGGGNRVYNNIISGFNQSSNVCIDCDSNVAGIKSYVYNNTISSDCYAGIWDSAFNPVMVIKNNIVVNCSYDGYYTSGGWGEGSDYNVSYKADDLPIVSQTHSSNTVTVSFVNTDEFDFRLTETNPCVIDLGTDLSGDSYAPITTDIAGNTRGPAWDIGAFEYESGEPPAPAPAEQWIPQMMLRRGERR